MEKKLFFLDQHESTRFTKIFQVILGALCIIIVLYWLIFNPKEVMSGGSVWLTLAFLVLFGIYQLLAGTGRTRKYISTGQEKIILKQNSVLPPAEIKPSDLEMIELYPLSIGFRMKSRTRIKFRFGLSYPEIIEPVKKEVLEFARLGNIPVEVKDEEM